MRGPALRTAGLAAAAWSHVGLFVLLPLAWMLRESHLIGRAKLFDAMTAEHAVSAIANTGIVVGLTLLITTPLGVLTALVLTRDRFPGRRLIEGIVDLPFAAPAAIGAFALLTTYGPRGLFGPLFEAAGLKIVFAMPGMVLATVFVTMPFVIRETAAMLEEAGEEAEEAAITLGASRMQTFFLVTLPSVREGILYGTAQAYARGLGEFGAVLILSGNIIGVTQTMPIHIYDAYVDFDMASAYAGALVLVALSIGGMGLLEIWKRRWQS